MIYKIFDVINYHFIKILIIFCLTVISMTAQDSKLNNEERTKADELLAQSRKAIGLETEKLNIEKISLIFSVTRNSKFSIKADKIEQDKQSNGEIEFHSGLPDKFRYFETMTVGETTSIVKFILNDNLLDEDRYTIWEGQRTDVQIPGQENPTDEQKRRKIQETRKEVFFILFPVLLDSTDFFPLEFKYVGKAEFNTEKADVIEATFDKNTNIRLFFDEATHLLKLLSTVTKFQNNYGSELKRFYSDYQNVAGVMLAKKINIESKRTTSRIETHDVEEYLLKSLKINPTYKGDFFEVKKK